MPTPRQLIALLAALMLITACALVAGCGDSDDESASASDDRALIVKADFIQAANAACEERGEEMQVKSERIFANAGNKSSDALAKELTEKVIAPSFERELRELRSLSPPPGDEDQVNEIIDTIQQMVKRTQQDYAIGRDYPYRKTENISAAYGLPACGRPLAEE